MKAKLLLLFLFSMSILGYGNQSINDYINIKGTRLLISPPKGFTPSKNFVGLDGGDKGIIQVMDMVGGNFESNTATYTRLEFEKRGVTVLDFKELTIDGFKAKFAHIVGNQNMEGIQIVFGDATFSVMVNAFYPSQFREEQFQTIKNSLLTMKYDKKMVVDPFAASHFLIHPNTSKFKFTEASANMFLFSENGIKKESYGNDPIAMITTYPFDTTMKKESLIDNMINELVQQGFIKKEIKTTDAKSINGYDSFIAEVYFQHKSEEKLAYMAVLIKNDIVVFFNGMAQSKYETNIVEFKKLIQAIKIK
ncbi:hypothetical protein [Flavobacterium sp. GCM10023249]|uniref:hypothetical protein n=1 Tax=unclassified Flavobacterium TaxID=196869 RepID=UPI00360C587D